jgi:stringent starvation protein B
MDLRSEEKRQQLERSLERGAVIIHLDARRPGVIVPARFRQDFHLRLNLSLRFDPPDLSVGEWGVRETLGFGGVRFAVAVPWSAIFAITGAQRSDQAWLYAEDMPKELFDAAARHFGLTGDEVRQLREEAGVIDRLDLVEAPALEQGRTALRLVTEELKARSGPSDGQDAPEGPKPKGCHLKLVK